MLVTAHYQGYCRECGGEIRVGERLSSVDGKGPYHIRCTPLPDDIEAAHREVAKASKNALAARVAKAHSRPSAYIAIITATLLAEFLIVGAIAWKHPPGYYVLLRLIVCGLSGFFAFRLFKEKHAILSVLLGFSAVLYNPILQVRFPREDWQLINSATVPLLAAALFVLRPRKRV